MKKTLLLLLSLAFSSLSLAAVRTATLIVEGWTCGGCAAATRVAIQKLDGVAEVTTDYEKTEAVVAYDDSMVTPEKIVQTIRKLGYHAAVKEAAPAGASSVPYRSESDGGSNAPAADGESTQAERRLIAPDRVTIFATPLGCCAVEGLGCGSLAKPVLVELEGEPKIEQAWLNRPGTVLAIVWKEAGGNRSGIDRVEAIFEERGLEANALKGSARVKALQDFLAGSMWYRAAHVHRLSEEEARVIASRLVSRIEKRAALTPERAAALRDGLAGVFRQYFVEGVPEGGKGLKTDLLQVARNNLDAGQLSRFEEALRQGIGQIPGEPN